MMTEALWFYPISLATFTAVVSLSAYDRVWIMFGVTLAAALLNALVFGVRLADRFPKGSR